MHDYNTILGVIELRLSKVSYDAVQKRYRIGRSGIALIMNRYNDSGLSLDDLRQMPASKVVDLIYPKENLRHKDIPLPDFEKIHVPVITRIPIRIIFHPCFKKDLIWSLMEIPANAPTIVSGAVKLILLTASMTPSLTGEIGQATKRPKIEQYAIIGSFNGTSLLITKIGRAHV